jgi:hypothetical protein
MYFLFNHTINTMIKFLQIVLPVFAYKRYTSTRTKKIE